MTIRRKGGAAGLGALALLALGGCTDDTPTSTDGGLVPVDAETYEIFLPFDFFAQDFRTFGGFGAVSQLGTMSLAHEWTREEADPEEGTVEMRTLVRFAPLPDTVFVPDPDGDGSVPETDFTPVSGRLTVFFDTVGVEDDFVADITAAATEFRWDRFSAGWTMAVDTLGDRTQWPEAGGGPVRVLETRTWERSRMEGDSLVLADSVVFEVDSLTVNEWADPDAAHRGLRLETETENVRLRIRNVALRVDVRPEMNPDTLVTTGPPFREPTFIYSPEPTPAPGHFLLGGTPAHRAYLTVELPAVLEGDEEVCEFLPCPLELLPERVLFASLVLQTARTTPPGLQPREALNLEIRPALSPERVPRSPLGAPVQAGPRQLVPEAFREEGLREVEIPMTRYIQEVIRGLRDPDEAPPTTLALLTQPEPRSIEVGTFQGPGSPGQPRLRLIITISDGVTLP